MYTIFAWGRAASAACAASALLIVPCAGDANANVSVFMPSVSAISWALLRVGARPGVVATLAGVDWAWLGKQRLKARLISAVGSSGRG